MTGTYEHSIDNAGRLIVPAKLREELGSTFYLAVGVKENLTLINGAKNAAVLAAQILAVSDEALAAKLDAAREAMSRQIAQKEAKLQEELG